MLRSNRTISWLSWSFFSNSIRSIVRTSGSSRNNSHGRLERGRSHDNFHSNDEDGGLMVEPRSFSNSSNSGSPHSNNVAMDEVVDELPNNEKLPAYDTIASNQPPGYQQTLIISLEDISQVMVDGLRVGSYRDFFIGCCICCVFQILGIVYVMYISKTHAHRFGMMSAVGLTLFLLSSIVPLHRPQEGGYDFTYSGGSGRHRLYQQDGDDYFSAGDYYQKQQRQFNRMFQMFVSVSSLLGYLLLIYSLLAYRQIRSSARQMIMLASNTV